MTPGTPKILLATDLSEPARGAAEVAVAEARRRGASLHVLRVARSPAQTAAGSAEADELAAGAGKEVPVVLVIRVGSPAAEIVRYAEEKGVELIVIGGHGRTGVTRALLGSVAERVVRTSTRPVLVVPHATRPPTPALACCIVCGTATEDLVCTPCRANIRLTGGAAQWAARGAGPVGELDRAGCEQVLRANLIGRLGCYSGGRIYVVPISHVYEDGAIYLRSAEGTKARMMRESPGVCLQVDHIVDLVNWRSVIAWGTFHELHGDEATRGLQKIMRRLAEWAGDVDGRPAASFSQANTDLGHRAVSVGRTAVIGRIDVTEMTGRYQQG